VDLHVSIPNILFIYHQVVSVTNFLASVTTSGNVNFFPKFVKYLCVRSVYKVNQITIFLLDKRNLSWKAGSQMYV
jgi:hypothetical protein